MAVIDNIVERLFSRAGYGFCSSRGFNRTEMEKPWPFMVVPVEGDRTEIPVMMLDKFSTMLNKNAVPDEFAVSLHSNGCSTTYKSFSKIMEVVLGEPFKKGLIRTKGVDGSKVNVYYATHGALFSDSFKPLMMCSWILEKRPCEAEGVTDADAMWHFAKPIMRISPDFYLQKYDNVGRFVNKKLLSAVLESYVMYGYTCRIKDAYENFKPTVEIAECPFKIATTMQPSISTTNSSLAKIVIDNMSDFTL